MLPMQPFTSTPSHPRRVFSSSIPSTRHGSTSTAPSAPTTPVKSPNASTSTGIPAFRSLRSLFPFGPSKATTLPAVHSTPNALKSTFSSFGSMRRSMQKDGKPSLDVELPPVISIDRVSRDESAVRRSVSYSNIQSIDRILESASTPFEDDDDTIVFPMCRAPILRTPSPGPPISADLSTIIEADTSGMSKHIPSSKDPSRAPSPDMPASHEQSHPEDTDTSVLDLSTTHVEDQVLDAMRSETSNKPQEWNAVDKAFIIDGDGEDPDSLNLDALDSDLAAILSPRRFPTQRTNANVKSLTISSPQKSFGQPEHSSPRFVLAPSPIISGDTSPIFVDPLRLRLPRQQSSLPRLRPATSPSHLSYSPSPSTIVPSPNASDSTRCGDKTDPPSPFTVSAPTYSSVPPSPATAFTPPRAIYSPLSPPTASTSFFSRRSSITKASSSVSSAVSSQPASTSTISRLRTPFTQMPRSGTQRIGSSAETDVPDVIRAFAPSSTSRLDSQPSLESTSRERASFDRRRPSLSDTHHFEHTNSARSSLDALRKTATDTENSRIASAVLERARKRSLSVQERVPGRHIPGGSRSRGTTGEADRKDNIHGITEFGEQRPSSSHSMGMGRRLGRAESMSSGSAPVTEWLGPRTVKAFKAAGLLDFERDQQPHSDRNSPGSLNSSAGPTRGKFAPMRSTSEYCARAPSRLAPSEAGGSSLSRRGSSSGTYGLMESPTFTASSSSRDMARSASTAPTSVSGSSFAFVGRDRDREREEIRELKEKHASETEALLAALSDSQRTTKLLREENVELRDRLEQAEGEIDALRRVVGELTKETGDLRVQIQVLKSTSGTNSKPSGGITRKSGFALPLRIDQDDDRDISKSFNTVNDSEHDKLNVTLNSQPQIKLSDGEHHHPDTLEAPVSAKHKRRFSTTSSIFPVPPANMTMLLHDHGYEQDTGSFNGSFDQSQFPLSAPIPSALHDDTVTRNTSLMSVTSISPTTANFSITTDSPASLFLRPEHEMHLGDMDSLDLGITRNTDITRQDGWSD